MREKMHIDGFYVNLLALPYIFTSKQRHPKTKKNMVFVFGSTKIHFDKLDLFMERRYYDCVILNIFSSVREADYWITTYIYEEKWVPHNQRKK